MRQLVKKLLEKVYLDDFARHVVSGATKLTALRQIKRDLRGIDKKFSQNYLNAHEVRKLHIGCGQNILEDWLNADFYPSGDRVLFLDATKPFPFNDGTFDYVFSEHMIEHITYAQGLQMLAECYRILKPHGKLRIATPDLVFLIDLYRSEKSDIQKKYVEWSIKSFIQNAPRDDDTFVINNFVRDWGHQFIYDEKTLRFALESVGFRSITRREVGESDDPQLRNLENEGRMPEGFLRLESITMEVAKLG